MAETWKDVPGFEGKYQVSNCGNVRSVPGGHRSGGLLKPGKSSNGYLTVALYKDSKSVSYLIQDLVMAAFVGPKPPHCVTRHMDDNREHNSLDNLQYGSQSENYKDVYRLGGTHKKLTADDVLDIRKSLEMGEDKHVLAEKYNVCERVIRNIRAGRSFSWIR